MSKIDFQYTRLYLKKYLVDNDDPRKDDDDFINNRGAAAEEAYEKAFRSGLTPNQAKEVAMKVLMEGIEVSRFVYGLSGSI
jgi:hypothetical protein